MAFTLTTNAWQPNGAIPTQYTCDGQDISPPLTWNEPPAGTQSLVLIMNDPDAPHGNWTHWVLFNLPAAVSELPENVQTLPPGTQAGKNSWGRVDYGGPCPPDREHRYFFNLYALNTPLDLPAGVDLSVLQKAMQGHVLGGAELVGRYQRQLRENN